MTKFAVFLAFFFMASPLFATDLNGKFEENSDGTFNVNVDDGYHEFHGWGEEMDDDNLQVSVKDNDGHTYVGRAQRNLRGGYALDLHNEGMLTPDIAQGYIYDH